MKRILRRLLYEMNNTEVEKDIEIESVHICSEREDQIGPAHSEKRIRQCNPKYKIR